MEDSQYIKLLERIAEKYLPKEYKGSPEKIYTLQKDNAVISDLKVIKGKNYGDLKDNNELARLAKDSYEWNKFLLKKKYNIDIEADVEAGKYSEEDAFTYTTMYGHRGAIPYLQGKKKMPQDINSDQPFPKVTESEPASLASDKSLPEKVKDVPGSKPAAVASAVPVAPNPDMRSYTLRSVEISEKRKDVFNGTGRTLDEVTSEVQDKLKDKDISDKEALKEAQKIIGADDKETAIKIIHTDTGIISGPGVDKHKTDALWPITQMDFITGYSTLNTNGSEQVQLSTKAGDFSDQQRFIIKYFLENKDLPNQYLDDQIKTSPFTKDKNNIYTFKLTLTEEAIDKYLPDLKPHEKKQLLKPFDIRMQDTFSPDGLQAWKDWAAEEANGLPEKMKFNIYSRSVNIAATNQLYSSLCRTDQVNDYDYINTFLGTEYGGDKSITIQAYKEFQREYILNTRPSEFARKQAEAIKNEPEKYSSEQKLSAEQDLETQKNAAEQGVLHAQQKLAELKAFKPLLKESGLADLYDLSQLLDKKELLSAQFDSNIINSRYLEERTRLTKDYQEDIAKLERKLAEYNKAERAKIFSDANNVLATLDDAQKKTLETIIASAQDQSKKDNSRYLKAAKPDPLTQVSLDGGALKAGENRGFLTDLRVEHMSGRNIGKFSYDIDVATDLSYATNYHPDKKGELFTPMEFNDLTRDHQKIRLSTKYNYTNHNSIQLDGCLLENNAGTQQKFSVRNNFENINRTTFYAGLNLPALIENPVEKLNVNYGVTAGIGKKLYLTGDDIKVDAGVGISSANYKNSFTDTNIRNQTMADLDLKINYQSDAVNLVLRGSYTVLNPFSNAGNSTSLTFLNLSANKNLPSFDLTADGNLIFSPYFKMQQLEVGGTFKTGILTHALTVEGQRIILDKAQFLNQDVLKLGYHISPDSQKKIFKDADIGIDYTFMKNDQDLPVNNVPFRLSVTKIFR